MRNYLAIALVAATATFADGVLADPAADALLKRAFDNYRADSSQASVAMTVHRPDWERRMEMNTWTRGTDDAIVRFTAPAKDAGNATLKIGQDTWVFNPRLNQVIKLPPSMMAQSWMGSDFSYNDLSKSETLLTDFTHRITQTATENGHRVTTIEADPKPGAAVVWGKVTIRLRDDDVVVEEVFFDQDMKPARRMETEKIGPLAGRAYPLVMSMYPADTPGQWTRIETERAAFNTTVPDYLFTLSNLQNPRECMIVIAALAWRNLWRQPQRTLLSIASIAFTSALLVFMLSFQVGVYAVMKTNLLRIFDGFAQAQAFGYLADPDMHRTIAAPERLAAGLRRIDGVDAASPRIVTFALLANNGRSLGAGVIGVDPVNEPRVSTLPATVRRGRYLVATDSGAAVIGDGLARDLGLGVGGRITLLGSSLDGSVAADVLDVVGIFHSGLGDLDRQVMEIPLAHAQDIFGLGDRANVVAMAGPTLSGVDNSLPRLRRLARRQGIAIADWTALEPSLEDSITLKIVTSGLMYATLVAVVVFIILNTLLMSVLERTREFGMLLALGMRPRLRGHDGMAGTDRARGGGKRRRHRDRRRGDAVVRPSRHRLSGLENVLSQFGLPAAALSGARRRSAAGRARRDPDRHRAVRHRALSACAAPGSGLGNEGGVMGPLLVLARLAQSVAQSAAHAASPS